MKNQGPRRSWFFYSSCGRTHKILPLRSPHHSRHKSNLPSQLYMKVHLLYFEKYRTHMYLHVVNGEKILVKPDVTNTTTVFFVRSSTFHFEIWNLTLAQNALLWKWKLMLKIKAQMTPICTAWYSSSKHSMIFI